MALAASCPRCTTPLGGDGAAFTCDEHGGVEPLWRSATADYDSFAEVAQRARGIPTYLPWPLSPGWSIADFGCVAGVAGPAVATFTTVLGASDLDGEVVVSVVAEEPGVGLGARCSGTARTDPPVGVGRPAIRVRADSRPVPLWPVGAEDRDPLTRSVFAGEAGGRWLWLVLRPASAALLLRDEWLLADAGGFGPEAIEMSFGGRVPPW